VQFAFATRFALLSPCSIVAVGLVAVFSSTELTAQETGKQKENAPAPAAQANLMPASDEEISKWIDELSHDTFSVREAAASRLLAAGTPARDALQPITNGPDPEARAAARRLVVLIDRTEFARRLEAFAADTDGRRKLTLPGWKQFRKLVGDDPPARALFVDMQRAEGPMFAAAFEKSGRPPQQLWEERLMRLVSWQVTAGNRNVPAPMASCTAMIFLGSVPDIEVSDNGAMLVDNLIQRPPVREAVMSQGPRDAVRRLVAAWIHHCPNTNEDIVMRRLNLITGLGIREAIGLPLDVATQAKSYASLQPITRAKALTTVGQFGNRAHIEQLEPLLEDTSICMPLQGPQPGQPVPNVQIRDVALVVMLQLTGQQPADYGYLHARLQPQQAYVLESLHCESTEKQEAAAAKWRAWRKSQKGRELRVKGREPEERGAKAP
jgi:hypothetical protein